MKNVIYKTIFGYFITTEENYNAKIPDSNLIQKCYDFDNAQDIVNYFCKYLGHNPKEFIIINE